MDVNLKNEIACAEYALGVAQRDFRQAQDRVMVCQERLETLKLRANESPMSVISDTRTLLNG